MKLHALLLCFVPLLAQPPVHVDYACPAEDIESFGLTCSEDRPCPVYFEVSAVDSFGAHVFVAGDIHTATTTLFGVLLSSDDRGKTWEEEIPRLRGATFGQLQVMGDHAWLAGQHVDPLPREPFFFITADAGKNWHQRPLFEESRFGSIQQFWFQSPLSGELIFDDSVGKATDQELFGTNTGGEMWRLKQKSAKPLQLAKTESAWSAAAPPGSATYLIEHLVNGTKQTFAHFLIHIGDCK